MLAMTTAVTVVYLNFVEDMKDLRLFVLLLRHYCDDFEVRPSAVVFTSSPPVIAASGRTKLRKMRINISCLRLR
jgi:hypothetical protein